MIELRIRLSTYLDEGFNVIPLRSSHHFFTLEHLVFIIIFLILMICVISPSFSGIIACSLIVHSFWRLDGFV